MAKSGGGRLLGRLLGLRGSYGTGRAEEKADLVEGLANAALGTAEQVLDLHEALLFLRAYPDDGAVLLATETALRCFADRRDVRRFRRALSDTGVAGTTIQYGYSWPMAKWLARRDPSVSILWDEWESGDELDTLLTPIAAHGELCGVDDETMSSREWLENATPEGSGDYAALVSRLEEMRAAEEVKEHLFNGLDIPVLRDLGESGDTRTLARFPDFEPHFQDRALDHRRPNLAKAILKPPTRRPVDEATGAVLLDMARACMSVRLRELHAYDFGDPTDAWIADAGRGLLITGMGLVPDRRLLPETLYAGIFLKNGVPCGYWLASALFRTSEVALNIFPAYRGGESAWIYGRLLALLHDFYGAETITIPRYQFGHENDEALSSGAFWFYQKLGFRPRGRDARRIVRDELAKIRKDRSHRSTLATLRALAEENVEFHTGKPHDGVIGVFPYGNLGHCITRCIAERGGKRPTVLRKLANEAAAALGVKDRKRWTADERRAFEAWAPVVPLIPGLSRWGAKTKRDLAAVFRAKGAASEVEFARLANRHGPFQRAVLRLCRDWEESPA